MYATIKEAEREVVSNSTTYNTQQSIAVVVEVIPSTQIAAVPEPVLAPEPAFNAEYGTDFEKEDEEPEDLITPQDALAEVTHTDTYAQDEEAVDYTGTLNVGSGSETATYDADDYVVIGDDYFSKVQKVKDEKEDAKQEEALNYKPNIEEEVESPAAEKEDADYDTLDDEIKPAKAEEADYDNDLDFEADQAGEETSKSVSLEELVTLVLL